MIQLDDTDEAVLRNGIRTMKGFACEHVLKAKFDGVAYPDAQHCDKKDLQRGACCNACWARRWAEKMDGIIHRLDRQK